LDNALSWDWYKSHIIEGTTKNAKFVRAITASYPDLVPPTAVDEEMKHPSRKQYNLFNLCDAMAIAVVGRPDAIRKRAKLVRSKSMW
jgi:hypothetical protein